ncbi:MAG: DNA primase [Candidatus Hydrogenedentota bacterium]
MPKFSREVVSEVLAANDIVEVIGAFIDLKAAGPNRFVGLCPFHQEKTPSFSVTRDRQMFYCFGCQRSGDALSFVREFEGVTFLEALQKLADRGGVRLPAVTERDDREAYLRQQVLTLNKFAQRFFQEYLEDPLKGGRGRSHLNERELQKATIQKFGLGYAPEDGQAFIRAARQEGYKDAALKASGLVRESDRGGIYGFFRNRLMFPIADGTGRTVAFGGRALDAEAQAKYINTPENSLYKKSGILYGLHHARDAMRREKQALLVEGYFDLLRCHDAGLAHVVAPCGTALTEEQAALLRRHVPEVVLVFDGDSAGARAALRGIGVLAGAGLRVRALALPEGQDPDDCIRAEGAEAFRERIAQASGFVDFFVRMNQERMKTAEGRSEVAHELLGVLQRMEDELRRQEYLEEAAKALGTNKWDLQKEYDRVQRRTQHPAHAAADEDESRQRPVGINLDDRRFIAVLLEREELLTKCRDELQPLPMPEGALGEVLRALFEHGASANLAQELEHEAGLSLYAAAAASEDRNIPADRADGLVKKRISRIKKDALQKESARLHNAIREAERRNDIQEVMALLTEKRQIDNDIQHTGAA